MKIITIKLTIETFYEVPNYYSEESTEFYLEENLCVHNVLSKLCKEMEEDNQKGVCRHCDKSTIEIINNDK